MGPSIPGVSLALVWSGRMGTGSWEDDRVKLIQAKSFVIAFGFGVDGLEVVNDNELL